MVGKLKRTCSGWTVLTNGCKNEQGIFTVYNIPVDPELFEFCKEDRIVTFDINRNSHANIRLF